MSFPWMDRTQPKPGGADRHAQSAATELAHRAATLFRLGFSAEDATHRLQQRVRWEYDDTPNAKRPETLSDSAVAKIVTDTYARKPG